jgi:hypothetical protein
VQLGFSEPIIPGPLGQASPNDQTKSRRTQALDGSGAGSPTGGVLRAARMLMPSVPLLSTDETAWQLMQDACLRFIPTFSPSVMELPSSFGS